MDLLIGIVLNRFKEGNKNALTHSFRYNGSGSFDHNGQHYSFRGYICPECGTKLELSSFDLRHFRKHKAPIIWGLKDKSCNQVRMDKALS